MPRVIRDNELTTGLTKASPVVIPDKMPMTTLNLDLNGKAKQVRKKTIATKTNTMYSIVKLRKNVWKLFPEMTLQKINKMHSATRGALLSDSLKGKSSHDGSVTMEREVKTCDAVSTGVSYLGQAYN